MNNLKPFFLVLFLIFLSCKQSKTYEGESYINYPDFNMLYNDYIAPYEKSAVKILRITTENGHSDSLLQRSEEVDWNHIKSFLNTASINNESHTNKYSIDLINDTLYQNTTVVFSALAPNELTKKVSISAQEHAKNVKTIYIEYEDNGFFSSTKKKFLYKNGQFLQLVEMSKKPFSKAKEKITLWKFVY
ncbi:MAG: hypothetical protein R2831_03980 [Chitinophagaceae bacterium]